MWRQTPECLPEAAARFASGVLRPWGRFLGCPLASMWWVSVLDSGHPLEPAAVALEKKREEKQLSYAWSPCAGLACEGSVQIFGLFSIRVCFVTAEF